MNLSTPARVAAFATGLSLVFAVTLGVGRLVGPVVEPPADEMAEHAGADDGMGDEHGGGAEHLPGGLMVSQDGYTLVVDQARAPAGQRVPLSFRIVGPDGEPVTAYEVEHEKLLHLIVVRRDGTGFQHVHPELDVPTGVWTTEVDLRPGDWRILADFVPGGADEGLTLGTDLAVPGTFEPAAVGPESRTAEVGRYTVTLDGDLTAGTDADVTLTVERDGQPVTDLQPYLGAYGHLVALRDGDLAYLHVHPEHSAGDGSAGPSISFVAEVPSAGRYFLYLDFQHGDRVRTAAFIVEATR